MVTINGKKIKVTAEPIPKFPEFEKGSRVVITEESYWARINNFVGKTGVVIGTESFNVTSVRLDGFSKMIWYINTNHLELWKPRPWSYERDY